MIVLGVDPGTAATGYGVVRGGEPGGPTLIECGVIRTSPRASLARDRKSTRLNSSHT